MRARGSLPALLAILTLAAPAAGDPSRTSCEICHADAALFGAERVDRVAQHGRGVHAEVGLSCHDCHGGNPDPALAADAAAAMDPDFVPQPHVGAPARAEVPAFCGRCHSDPAFMRRFAPAARVDQEREYGASHHGRALAAGDPDVPTCVDCHAGPAILRIGDPASPVYPTNVADTCASCHADAERMGGHRLADGRPLPIDQYARWRRSVHAAALIEREDLSAPTCNDCHGNHAAAPPEVTSIAQICGHCHGREARLFQGSSKAEGLERHNAFLASAGEQGCAACHAEPEPQAALDDVHSLGQCGVCHGNHAVVRPTVAMLSPLPETPCAFCHEGPRPDWDAVWGGEAATAHYAEVRSQLVASAEAQGLEGDARFDWLVDVARNLPFHTLGAPGPDGQLPLRPEFERLFLKFRIGKTHFQYRDPVGGGLVSAPITRCTTCHAAEPLLADEPRGLETAGRMLEHMRELTALTAMAERTLLRARRGGVALRDAPLEIDHAVDAQVGLEVLLHGFSVEPGSEFVSRFDSGMEHAAKALGGARRALGELASRRRGLAFFLVVVAGVLVVLALKIRQISARRALEEREAGSA